MSKLSDFFQPLNFINLVYFVAALVFFDVFGCLVKSLFIKNEKVGSETRLVDWLIGLGSFVFLWFLLGFFVTPNQTFLLVSIVALFLISLPRYLKEKTYLSYFTNAKQSILPIILLIPFLPSTFVKASLPPYYADEMAYHFISPYSMLHQMKLFWTFTGGVYMNVPRLMDTFYILGFTVTHTYSVIRLIQFSILGTALVFAFLLIKKILGSFSAILYIFIFLSMPLALPFMATIGYVDVPAYSFLLLGVVLAITFLFSNKNEYLILSAIFWGMSIGTKYTTLIPFAVFVPSLLLVYLIKYKSLLKLFNKGLIIKIFLGLIVFGGYWYIKNLVVYGNPIYPFFFHCWGNFVNECGNGSSFFGTWTNPVNFHTLYPIIIKQLLPQNLWLHLILVVSPLLVFIFGNRKNRLLLLLVSLPFFGELIILKYFSGFAIRYQQHLEFYLIFMIMLFVSTKFRNLFLNLSKYVLVSLLVISCLIFYVRNAINMNSLNFVNWEEINYSLGKVTIYDWIKKRIPETADATIWCENPQGGPIGLARFDPDMIWYKDAGLLRSYLVGCYWENPSLSPSEWKNIISVAKERKLAFWTVTINSCLPEDKVKSKEEIGDSNNDPEKLQKLLEMRRLNNAIVCNSEQVLPSLYHFDYQKLK